MDTHAHASMGMQSSRGASYSRHRQQNNPQPPPSTRRIPRATPHSGVSDWGVPSPPSHQFEIRDVDKDTALTVIARMVEGLFDYGEIPDFVLTEAVSCSSP